MQMKRDEVRFRNKKKEKRNRPLAATAAAAL